MKAKSSQKKSNTTLVELSAEQLDQVTGGAGQNWYDKQVNGGGQEPKGEANGVPTYTYNNGGHLKSVS